MLCHMVINRNDTNLLGFSAIICFIIAGESLLLIPHHLTDLLPASTIWLNWIAGYAFFGIGLWVSASLFLNHTLSWQRVAFTTAALAALALTIQYARAGRYIETIWFGSLSLAFLAANRFDAHGRGWHTHALTVANLACGLLLLSQHPLSNDWVKILSNNNLILAVIFLTSSLINMVVTVSHHTNPGSRVKLLGIPWLLWSFFHLIPLDFPALLVALTAAACGLLDGVIPWERLILREGYKLGRRFFIIFGLTLALLLFLMSWFLLVIDHNLQEQVTAWQLRELAFGGYNLLMLMLMFIIASIHLSINGLISGLYGEHPTIPRPQDTDPFLQKIRQALMMPFSLSRDLLNNRLKNNQEYEDLLNAQMRTEKKRMAQLSLLHQINLAFETILDPPVSAQLAVNAILNATNANLCAIMEYDALTQRLVTLASNGKMSVTIPPGYAQGISQGIMGRAARLRRTQLVSDTRLDPDYIHLDQQIALTELVVPLIHGGHFKGVLVIDADQPNAFDDSDIRTMETIALRVATSWERADHDARLTHLIEAGIALSTTLDIGKVIEEIAEITLNVMGARFVFVALTDKGGSGFARFGSAGEAPTLAAMLGSDPHGNTLIQTVLHQQGSLRLRDVRKRFVSLPTGDPALRNLLATPIRLRQSSIGAILVFGKANGSTFSDNDEALANLIATQAGGAIETSWLYQELRGMYNIATQLATLSFRVIQAETINDAAIAIAEVSYKLSRANASGIVILGSAGQIEAQVQIDGNGVQANGRQPRQLIEQSLQTGQMIVNAGRAEQVTVCMPLKTPRGNNGVLWIELPEEYWSAPNFSENLRTLSNQAAIALERSILLMETRRQAGQLEEAYRTLEQTYDQTLLALSSALDARDRETEGHSQRVANIAYQLGRHMNIPEEQAKKMERGAILHDIGKIGISDSILLKPGPLTEQEWQIMRQHPDIGARIVEGIPFLQDALPVIRYHQERWDGSGYPLGLKGEQIPFMARLFAVVDAFDALTTERPYRTKITPLEAIDYLKEQAGVLFDPVIVEAFTAMIQQGLFEEIVV